MNPSLRTFKSEFLNRLLDLLWHQWSALGVAGRGGQAEPSILDPEALLVFTCTMGRHEPRLFDEMVDWLQENGRFINVMRLKRILASEPFAGGRVVAAVAACLSKGAEAAKWRLLAESAGTPPAMEEFFIASDGKPLSVPGAREPHFARAGFKRGPLRLRGYSQKFSAASPACLALRLRALLGVSVRCEIVLYLLTHEAAHPSRIAREAYYFDRAVQSTLVDMSQSGVVQLRASGREKHYWLIPKPWAALLSHPEPFPAWTTWPALFSALEQIWWKLQDPRLEQLTPLVLSSELRHLMIQVRPALERARFDKVLSDDRPRLGEDYLPVFFADILNLVQQASPKPAPEHST